MPRPSLGVAATTLLVALLLAAHAGAAAPDLLLQIPEGSTASGEGAGRFGNPREMAADPTTGHLFVSDLGNSRISEYTAWGKFVKAWGWDVAPEGAPGDTSADQLEVCTATCKAGIAGDGAGQLNLPTGIALDANGDLYVYELDGRRVQKFSPDGSFELMFGGEVNRTTGADICVKADLEGGDECGTGALGTADGWFSNSSVHNFIDYSPATNTVFVGDKDRIQEFNLDGTFKAKIDFEGGLTPFSGQSVGALATDPNTGDIYLTLDGADDVQRLDPTTGKVTATLPILKPSAVAVDVDGNVYALESAPPSIDNDVLGFDASGAPIEGMEDGDRFATPPIVDGSGVTPTGIAANVLAPGSSEPGDLYVTYAPPSGSGAYINAYGPPPVGFEEPPPVPPEIDAQYATSVGIDGTTVRAEINPHFWQDATYYLQYGTKACPEAGWEGPACQQKPAPPGALLSAKSLNTAVKTAAISLGELQADTTYHYRFVAESGGGGPVAGLGGKPGEDGAEATLHTFPLPDPSEACPANERFRTGPSAKLPDCRAYELVSPLEKNGGGATQLGEKGAGSSEELNQSATSGGRFTFTSKTGFLGAESTPWVSQYLAARAPGEGWSTEPISPPRTHLIINFSGVPTNEYQMFSPDLCAAWLRHGYAPTLAPGAVDGYGNLYERDNCAQPRGYEPLTTVEPLNRSPEDYFRLLVQGSSADGAHTIFSVDGKLTDEAAALPKGGNPQLYEHLAGQAAPRLVCILPDGTPSSQTCGAGLPGPSEGAGRGGNVQGAISVDGSRIFWTTLGAGAGSVVPGRIYARIDSTETVAVSQAVTPEAALFWGAAQDGSKAIFEVDAGPLKDNLYEFDVEKAIAEEAGAATLIAKGVQGLAGMSDDASRLYLASTEVLSGEAENSAGEAAQAGRPNLYLYEGGELSFVATLSAGSAALSASPIQRTARVSPDGRHLAFTSRVPLTGYDNTDVQSGALDTEVYLYDADQAKLHCVSCNPTGARPMGEAGDAAKIPPWERSTYASRLLSEDGGRLFFESHEALVPRDSNGAWDVYEWEAVGKGGCDKADATYGEASEGCVDLISSGESPEDSELLDADPSGSNVFFATLASLVSQDYGLIDVYDARVGGGFPSPQPKSGCEGGACRPASDPPDFPQPASAAYEGPGDPGRKGTKPRCGKGKRKVRAKGKTRCVRKQRSTKHTNAKRGAGR